MAKEAARLGLTQEAISAAAQVKAAEESKAKTELGKLKTEADIDLTKAQTEASKKTTERATEEFDYRKSQRVIEEAIKEANLAATKKTNESKQIQYDAAKLALDKAKAEFEAMPSGFYKRQYELKLEKLEADIKAAKALATYRERERSLEVKRKMTEVPIYNQLGDKVGKTVLYNDGTTETVYGTAAPSTEDTAAQAAKGMTPGSNILEQLKQPLLEERRRRDQERKNQPGAR
jgi:hypothetical protein